MTIAVESTAPVRPPAPRRLRSLPVPVTEPPEGEHRAAAEPATQGTLALSFGGVERSLADDADFGHQPTSSMALPDPTVTCAALVQALVEVLGGVRPVSQLVRWTTHEVHAALSRRTALAARVRQNAGVPSTRAAVVRGVRVCLPADGVAEGSAVVIDADRVRAVAVRLEGLDGRWRATALEVG
jgi:hypothetical protein